MRKMPFNLLLEGQLQNFMNQVEDSRASKWRLPHRPTPCHQLQFQFAALEIYHLMFSISQVPRYCLQSHLRVTQLQQMNTIPHPLPFTITYTTPKDSVPVTTLFNTLEDFQSYFCGWLFKNPVTNCAIVPACMNYLHGDSTVVYMADHPLYTTQELGICHHQATDKAFEEKVIKAIEHHLFLHGGIW
jgi:hypothetical protein